MVRSNFELVFAGMRVLQTVLLTGMNGVVISGSKSVFNEDMGDCFSLLADVAISVTRTTSC